MVLSTARTAGAALITWAVLWRLSDRGYALLAALCFAVLAMVAAANFTSPRLWEQSWWAPFLASNLAVLNMAAIRLFQIFPRPLTPGDLEPRAGKLILSRAARALLWALLRYPALLLVIGVVVFTAPLWLSDFSIVPVLGVCWSFILLGYLYANFRRANLEERQRIYWVFEGLLIQVLTSLASATPYFLNKALGLQLDPLFWFAILSSFGNAAFLACVAIAIFYSGALDASLVVRRTVVIGAFGALLTGIFFVLHSVVFAQVAHYLGFSERSITWITASVVAITFVLFRRQVELRIDLLTDRLLPATLLAHEGRRRFSVIVFGDLVGYSGISAADPTSALMLCPHIRETLKERRIESVLPDTRAAISCRARSAAPPRCSHRTTPGSARSRWPHSTDPQTLRSRAAGC